MPNQQDYWLIQTKMRWVSVTLQHWPYPVLNGLKPERQGSRDIAEENRGNIIVVTQSNCECVYPGFQMLVRYKDARQDRR